MMTDSTNPTHKSARKKLLKRCLVGGSIFGSLVGIVAIGLPFFLNSPIKDCSKKLESRTNVGSMNRAQQVHYLERDKFGSSLAQLGLGIKPQTEEYVYLTVSFRQVAFNYALSKVNHRRSRVGGVFLGKVPETGELTTFAITCEAKMVGTQAIEPPINAQTCGAGTEKVGP
jgi:Type IV pilin-like G and H, putative